MDRRDIVLIGLSGNTREMLEIIELQHRVLAILDDSHRLQGSTYADVPVRPIEALAEYPDALVLCLVGSAGSFPARPGLIGSLNVTPDRFATIVHPQAQVSRHACLGHGTMVCYGTTITAGARVGNHVVVMPQTVIHHDAEIGDYSLIGSHATIAGKVRIGAGSYIGSASSLRDGVSVGAGALVGMAANVVADVPPGVVVVGNPARVLRDVKAGTATAVAVAS